MKIKHLVVLLFSVAIVAVSCTKSAITMTKVKTASDTLSYAVGVNLFMQVAADSLELNPAVLAKAMLEMKNGKAFMDENGARDFFMRFMQQKEQEMAAKQAELDKVRYGGNIAKGDSFLQANKTQPGVVVTESGLQYKVIKQGNGPKPLATDEVKVHYLGTTIDGFKFDSSYDRNEPAQLRVDQVIKGWIEGLQLMNVGSKFMLYIPYDLGYGEAGAGGVIEPFSALIFEVELLEIVK